MTLAAPLARSLARGGAAANSILGLYASDFAEGLWLAPHRRETLFQDAAGTIPANAPGQPVGLIRDLSGRGNHATQAVALSRPILARHPASGLRQLLSNSTDLTAWGGIAPVVLHETLASGERVYEIGDTNAADNLMRSQSVNLPPGTYCLSARVKPGTSEKTRISVQNGSISAAAVVTWSGGTPASVIPNGPNVGAVSCDPDPVNAGYYILRCTILVALAGSFTVYLWPADWIPGGTTTGTSYFGSPQIETGTVRTGYQHAVSALDVTEPGYGDVWYFGTNGINQFFKVPNVVWGGSDEVTLIATVASNRTGVQSGVIRGGGNASPTRFGMVKQSNDRMNINSAGSVTASTTHTTEVSGSAEIYTMRAKIGAPSIELRVNGALSGGTFASQGTGSYLDYDMDIASWGGGQFHLGRYYGLLAINRLLSDAELSRVRSYMATISGVTLP